MNKEVYSYSTEEAAAASAVLNLTTGSKRPLADPFEERPKKEARSAAKLDSSDEKRRGMLPAPYYFYQDMSNVPDDDPLTPLTPPGRVPNFPAKLHAILSNPSLKDIVTWMPHGRSWRVLKPREFEIRVIPTYFEHSKFSSFIRQANGWGFRRVTQGPDRNSYYNEFFLRGLPHLSKKMKRAGVAEKPAADPEHEPNFYTISESFPVPEKYLDDDVLLECTLRGGPKARMPVHFGALHGTAAAAPAPSHIPNFQSFPKQDKSTHNQQLLIQHQATSQLLISQLQEACATPQTIPKTSLPRSLDPVRESDPTWKRQKQEHQHSVHGQPFAQQQHQQHLSTMGVPALQQSINMYGVNNSVGALINQNKYELSQPQSQTAFNPMHNLSIQQSQPNNMASHLSAAASHIRSALGHALALSQPQYLYSPPPVPANSNLLGPSEFSTVMQNLNNLH